MHARKFVGDIVLGKHDLGDPAEVLRLIVTQPHDLGCGETGKGYVRRK